MAKKETKTKTKSKSEPIVAMPISYQEKMKTNVAKAKGSTTSKRVAKKKA